MQSDTHRPDAALEPARGATTTGLSVDGSAPRHEAVPPPRSILEQSVAMLVDLGLCKSEVIAFTGGSRQLVSRLYDEALRELRGTRPARCG